MYNFIRKIYLKFKKIPFLGNFFISLRNIFSRIYSHHYFLRQRDFKEATNALDVIYPNEISAQKFLKDFRKSFLFNQNFSFGHSGDFDIMMLYVSIRMERPEVVVETGVASGRSSAAILQALYDNNKGKLYSIDLPQFYEEENPGIYITNEGNTELKGFVPQNKKPGWLVPEILRERWNLILGDSKLELPKLLKQLDQIDIFYHDSDHSYESMMFEFESVWPKLKDGGLLFSDDIKWNNSFSDFIEKENCKFLYAYRGLGIVKK